MKTIKMSLRIFLFIGLLLSGTKVFSQDPNFYIFLCFGQSNMVGGGTIVSVDRTVDSRFQNLSTVDCSDLGRIKGNWYTANSPLCRCNTGFGPIDYFGRTMVANLPSNVRVGVVMVAIEGASIEVFDKYNYKAALETAPGWFLNIVNGNYGGNPYQYLIDLAKLAQNDGVIKGILLHQGETNYGDTAWPSKVKAVYNYMMSDLGLNPASVPLLAGQLAGGGNGGMNYTIGTLPQVLPNSYVVSSDDCEVQSDGIHFTSAGYRELGKHYATTMLPLLRDGTPKFEYASVTDNNPKQIQVTMSKSIVDSSHFKGFTVKIDNQVVTIDSVVLRDTNQLVINLNVNILKDNEILLSYSNGNVVSNYNKYLGGFNDTLVNNLLKGAPPRIIELKTNENGDTLIAKFNMKMQRPSDISTLALKAEYNGDMSIPILESSFFNNDSTLLVFPLDDKVYADYKLLLSYAGNNISSSDSSLLKTFSDTLVTNYSKGLPVQIDTGKIEPDGMSGIFEFSKPLATMIKKSDFTLKVNKKSVSFADFYSFNNTILFTLSSALHYGDTITVTYTPGKVTATDKSLLEAFNNFPITNLVSEPVWLSIPGKIEAENYYSQSGISTENTGDIGGGLNVGWIDNGDWLEYGIENNTSNTSYEITFRVASPSGDGKFDFYLDNTKISQVTVPNTGGWQTYQSIIKNITIGPGKHYLKMVATNSGYNINYYNIKKLVTGIAKVNDDIIKIYPNPVSKEMIIVSADFRYNKVEIIDIMGKTVLSRLTANEAGLHIPVNLPNGTYIVKISNGKQFQLKRIIVENN